MKCPHCRVAFNSDVDRYYLGEEHDGGVDGHLGIEVTTCPECQKHVVWLKFGKTAMRYLGNEIGDITWERLVHPKGTTRAPAPKEVPTAIASDYAEACLVIADSPKASAALSRRCLQQLLRDAANATQKDLNDQINAVLAKGGLPTHITENIDGVRTIGNFAAHPIKSTTTGEIVDVENGEGEWNLDVLESLFDFYYVQPAAVARRKRDAWNAKLGDAGKPPMK